MKAKDKLPENYREIFSINLQKDKKTALIINLISFAVMLVMAVPMHFYISVLTMFDMEKGIGEYFLRFISFIVLIIAYIILHELVHGIAMKLFGAKKIKYGFTGMYAFAGSDNYYDKNSYLIIAMAPIVVWGIVLAAVNLIVPVEWFWVIYFIQIANISGASGDLYVSFKFSKMPKDILVYDSGISMTVYSAE